jgi:hypothetical protein
MRFSALDLEYITQQFDTAALSVVEPSQSAAPAADDAADSAASLQQAMLCLLEPLGIMQQQAMEQTLPDKDLDLNDLAGIATSLSLAPSGRYDIESACDDLRLALPDEPPHFFQEGVQRMERLNYTEIVREVVENDYKLWGQAKALH